MSCDKGCAAVVRKRHNVRYLAKTLEEYGDNSGNLITILQKAQEIYGYLSREIIEHIASALDLKPANVYGVATFYTQFRFNPVGKYIIMLCIGTACHVNGSQKIADIIYEELGITDGETTQDGMFTLMCVACIGCCSLSPVMMIDGETYGILTKEKVKAAFDWLRTGGTQGVKI